MKYDILKRAIQVKDFVIKADGVYISLSLLSYRRIIFSNTMFFTTEESVGLNESELLYKAITEFKELDEYKEYIVSLKYQQLIENEDGVKINKLSLEYNDINDLSGLQYLQPTYIIPVKEDFDRGYIKRYFAKYLNQENVFLELSLDDYNLLTEQDESTHFEVYDFFSFNWIINAQKEDILRTNGNTLKKYGELYPGFYSFHSNGEYKSAELYATIYDEIRNLYTIGRELAYEETLLNYSGYYHLGYLDGDLSILLSGKNNEQGNNDVLIEFETFEQPKSTSENFSEINNIIGSVKKITSDMNTFLGNLNVRLDAIKRQANQDIDDFKIEVEKSINDTIKGTDFEQVFECSKKDFSKLMTAAETDSKNNDSNGAAQKKAQEEITDSYKTKCNDKINVEIDANIKDSSVKRTVQKKIQSVSSPKVKIPQAPARHGKGQDHAYELGF